MYTRFCLSYISGNVFSGPVSSQYHGRCSQAQGSITVCAGHGRRYPHHVRRPTTFIVTYVNGIDCCPTLQSIVNNSTCIFNDNKCILCVKFLHYVNLYRDGYVQKELSSKREFKMFHS